MCNIYAGETPRIFTEPKPKARKNHMCCECGSTILPGQKYEKITGLWDNFETYKTCSFCAEIRRKARGEFDMDYDEGFVFGELWECVGFDYACNNSK